MYINEKDMMKVLEIICSKVYYNDNDVDFDFFVYQEDLDIQKISIHLFRSCANTLLSLDFIDWNSYGTETKLILASYSVKKDVWSLLNTLKKGVSFTNATSESKVEYDCEKYILKIDHKEINIKPTQRIPKEHFILKEIFKNDLKEMHDYTDLLKKNILIDDDGFKSYYHACDNLNKKIEKILKNKKRFVIAGPKENGNIQVNPMYL